MSNLTKYTGHLVEGMAWNKEKPTIEGFYWYKNDTQQPSIVEIYQDSDDDLVMIGNDVTFCYMSDLDGDTDFDGGEWSDPLPLPTDAPAQAYYKASEVEARDKQIDEVVDRFPELNMNNYNEAVVAELSRWGVEIVQLLD